MRKTLDKVKNATEEIKVTLKGETASFQALLLHSFLFLRVNSESTTEMNTVVSSCWVFSEKTKHSRTINSQQGAVAALGIL